MPHRDAFTETSEDMGERQHCLQPHRGVSSNIVYPPDEVLPSLILTAGEGCPFPLPGPILKGWYSSEDLARMAAGLEVMT